MEPREIASDLYFLKLAIGETSFPDTLKQRVHKLVSGAEGSVQAIASKAQPDQKPADAEEARRIRAKLDKDVEGALTQAQVDELNHRTIVIFAETFLLAEGAAGEFDEILHAAGIKLSYQKKKELDDQLEADEKKVRESQKSQAALEAMRQHIRKALSAEQLRKLEDFYMKSLNAMSQPADAPAAPKK
jgi:hypothetical protein